jgi:hypothetical protein
MVRRTDMNHTIRFHRIAAAGLGVVAMASLAMPSAAQGESPIADPSAIAVPAGHKEFLVTPAAGVQIYSCNATVSGFGWGFVAPQADLATRNGTLVGTHFGGPTWQARDGSTVVAARVDGATVDPTAIPWLLLSAVSTAAGPDGDRLTGTTFIQRTATAGGLAPAAAECNERTAGTTAEVPYTAEYHFWKATGG